MNVPKYFGVGATAVVAGAGVVGGAGVVATIIKENFLNSSKGKLIWRVNYEYSNFIFSYLRQVCELHVLDEDELDELHDVVNMDCRDGKKGRDDAHTYLDVDIDMVPGNVQHDELADTHMVAGRVLDEHTYVLVQQGKRARGDGLELPQHGKRADGDELELALHGKLFQDERLLGPKLYINLISLSSKIHT